MYLTHVGVIRLGHNWFLSNNAHKRDTRTVWIRWQNLSLKKVNRRAHRTVRGSLAVGQFASISLLWCKHSLSSVHWSYIDKQSFTRLWPRFNRWVSTVSVIQSHPLLMILADCGTLPWTQACEWRIYFTESHALRRVTTTIMDLKCFSENLAEKLRIQILHAVVHWMLRFFGFPVHFRSILSKNWMPNDNAIV